MMSGEKKRYASIDFWKFIFSIVILLFHSKNLMPEGQRAAALFPSGRLATEFFFIVSGFLMMMSIRRREEKGIREDVSLGRETMLFLKKKIGGILPEFLIAWVIAFAVMNLPLGREFSLGETLKRLLYSIWDLLFVTASGLTGWRANAVTWYLSAMLIGMLVLYPLIRKYKENFTFLIAPCIIIFGYAYMYQTCGGIDSPGKWFGVTNCGTLRGIIGLTVGCLCYEICTSIQKEAAKHSKGWVCGLSLLEIAAYLYVLVWMFCYGSSKLDFVVVLAMAVGITMTFTQITFLGKWLDKPFCSVLGKFSLSIYLGQCYWSLTLLGIFPDWSYHKLLVLYVGLTFVTALFINFLAASLRRFMNEKRKSKQ